MFSKKSPSGDFFYAINIFFEIIVLQIRRYDIRLIIWISISFQVLEADECTVTTTKINTFYTAA